MYNNILSVVILKETTLFKLRAMKILIYWDTKTRLSHKVWNNCPRREFYIVECEKNIVWEEYVCYPYLYLFLHIVAAPQANNFFYDHTSFD